MSRAVSNTQKLNEDDWAFVDMEGAVDVKGKIESNGRSKVKRKKRSRPQKQESEADFQVIKKDSVLTMSTIIATTEVPPFQRENSDDEDCRGVWESANPRVELTNESPSVEDVEFVQIPGAHGESSLRRRHLGEPRVELLSDSSSSCSFDIIDENKTLVVDNVPDEGSIHTIEDTSGDHGNDGDDCDYDGDDTRTTEFHFDFPTIVALFCLTTVLGFVMGHGVGIATSLLVVKTPSLKVPPVITPQAVTTPPDNESNEQNQNSQLEGKVLKWKSLYRKEKQTTGESKATGTKNSASLPGLKEAHKQLSLENYKLKKAYNDIEKQLDIMKVMSWYRRAQVDKLRKNDQMNMSYVVGILKKELQYLEAVYFREKRLADMWRNEENGKAEDFSNPWKEFKDRWSNQYRDESSKGTCTDKKECEGESRTGKDRSDIQAKKKIMDNTEHGFKSAVSEHKLPGESIASTKIESVDKTNEQEKAKLLQATETRKTKKDLGVLIKDTKASEQYQGDKQEFHGTDTTYIGQRMYGYQKVNPEDNPLWRHLRLANAVEDEDLQDFENEQTSLSSKQIKTGCSTRSKDQNGLSAGILRNGGDDDAENPSDMSSEESDITAHTERSTTGYLAEQEPEWFAYEVMEEDEDLIVAYENRDKFKHNLYGFLHGEFREITSGPGDVFVMSIKTECFNPNRSFVVSILNSSPKPIQFFAVLPNGKIKHQKISEQVKVTIVELDSREKEIDEEARVSPLVHEATVLENGTLVVNKRNAEDGESGEENDESCKENDESDDENGKSGEGNDESGDESGESVKENGESREGNVESDDENGISGERNDKSGDESGESVEENRESGEGNDKSGKSVEGTEEAGDDTSHPYQEIPLSILAPGESYFFEQRSGKIYRQTVSAHQYPISKYENLLNEIPKKTEKIYFRFSRNMLIEKFIIKDEVIKTNDDGSISIGGDDEGPAEDTAGNREPIEYEDDVSNITEELLKQPWKNWKRTPILMTYDSASGIVTSVFVTLAKVHPDDVISYATLKNGKIEKTEEVTKITSYILYGNEILRITREDEIKHTFANIQPNENIDGDFANNGNYENEDLNFNNSEIANENPGSSENEEKISKDIPQDEYLQASEFEDDEQVNQSEECTLKLGERENNEYLAFTVERGPVAIHETVERVLRTPKYQEEDIRKLNMSTNDVEESVSYIHCEDGSVQKIWRRIEKVSRNSAQEDSVTLESNGDDKRQRGVNYELEDGEEYDSDYVDSDDYDYEHDIDDDDVGNDDHSTDYDDDDDDDESDDDVADNIGDDNDETNLHYDDIDREYDEYSDDNSDDSINDGIDDDIDDDDHVDDINQEGTLEYTLHDHDEETLRLEQKKEETANKERSFSNAGGDLDEPETSNNDMDKQDYEMFISREWQNLKLRQQQFEHSKEQNMQLQQQMLQEWSRMKEQYKDLKENFERNQKSELSLEIQGIWNDLKHQQKQFENLKKLIEEDLRKSFKEEWEKLEKKQKEIELREKELSEEDPSKEVKEYQEITSDNEKDINEQQGALYPKENNSLYPERDEKENGFTDNIYEMVDGTGVESDGGEFTSSIQESADETVKVTWQNQFTQSNPTDDSYVAQIDSEAWEVKDGNSVEENFPQEQPPYAAVNDEKIGYGFHIDRVQSEEWEGNIDETEYTNEPNLPHEFPYISNSNEVVRENVFNINERQNIEQEESLHKEPRASTMETTYEIEENLPHEIPYIPRYDSNAQFQVSDSIFNIVQKQNEQQWEYDHEELAQTFSTTTRDKDVTPNEADEQNEINGLPSSETEDIPSSQWELQIQKLREELDRLYEAKISRRDHNQLQVVQKDIEPVSTENLSPDSVNAIQPKSPPKSHKPSSDSMEEVGKSDNVFQPKCPPKYPKTSNEDVNTISSSLPRKPQEKSKQQSSSKRQRWFPERSDDEMKQLPLPMGSGEKTKQRSLPKSYEMNLSEIKIEENERKRSQAFVDFLEAQTYLRQHEPEEYVEKIANGPLAPGKKGKKNNTNNIGTEDEKDYQFEYSKKSKNKRKQKKYLKKEADEDEFDKQSKIRKIEERHRTNNFPLNPHSKKKNTKKDKNSKKGQPVHKMH